MLGNIVLQFILRIFLVFCLIEQNSSFSFAQTLPVEILTTTSSINPFIIKGIKVHPQNPLELDFLFDAGQQQASSPEAMKSVKYFLAALTVPQKDLWVNLSPKEANRIIPEQFGITDMGRDLLAQDYLLKKLTASLMYPESESGKAFWDEIYSKIYAKTGSSDIPMEALNRVWIIPDGSVVYEKDYAAYVVKSHLKVMLEEDYTAQGEKSPSEFNEISSEAKTILRETIIPVIEKEVNEGSYFVQLRQIYNSLILATWYKRKLEKSLLGQSYVGRNKVDGIDIEDKDAKQKIFQEYVKVFQKGLYDMIHEDYDPAQQKVVPRKYFSGGMTFLDMASLQVTDDAAMLKDDGMENAYHAHVSLKPQVNQAMLMEKEEFIRQVKSAYRVPAVEDIPQEGLKWEIQIQKDLNLISRDGCLQGVYPISLDKNVVQLFGKYKYLSMGKKDLYADNKTIYAVIHWVKDEKGLPRMDYWFEQRDAQGKVLQRANVEFDEGGTIVDVRSPARIAAEEISVALKAAYQPRQTESIPDEGEKIEIEIKEISKFVDKIGYLQHSYPISLEKNMGQFFSTVKSLMMGKVDLYTGGKTIYAVIHWVKDEKGLPRMDYWFEQRDVQGNVLKRADVDFDEEGNVKDFKTVTKAVVEKITDQLRLAYQTPDISMIFDEGIKTRLQITKSSGLIDTNGNLIPSYPIGLNQTVQTAFGAQKYLFMGGNLYSGDKTIWAVIHWVLDEDGNPKMKQSFEQEDVEGKVLQTTDVEFDDHGNVVGLRAVNKIAGKEILAQLNSAYQPRDIDSILDGGEKIEIEITEDSKLINKDASLLASYPIGLNKSVGKAFFGADMRSLLMGKEGFYSDNKTIYAVIEWVKGEDGKPKMNQWFEQRSAKGDVLQITVVEFDDQGNIERFRSIKVAAYEAMRKINAAYQPRNIENISDDGEKIEIEIKKDSNLVNGDGYLQRFYPIGLNKSMGKAFSGADMRSLLMGREDLYLDNKTIYTVIEWVKGEDGKPKMNQWFEQRDAAGDVLQRTDVEFDEEGNIVGLKSIAKAAAYKIVTQLNSAYQPRLEKDISEEGEKIEIEITKDSNLISKTGYLRSFYPIGLNKNILKVFLLKTKFLSMGKEDLYTDGKTIYAVIEWVKDEDENPKMNQWFEQRNAAGDVLQRTDVEFDEDGNIVGFKTIVKAAFDEVMGQVMLAYQPRNMEGISDGGEKIEIEIRKDSNLVNGNGYLQGVYPLSLDKNVGKVFGGTKSLLMGNEDLYSGNKTMYAVVEWVKGGEDEKLKMNQWFEQRDTDGKILKKTLVVNLSDGTLEFQKVNMEDENSEMEEEVNAEIERITQLLIGHAGDLALRYGMITENLLWGMAGYKFRKTFDENRIRELIEDKLMKVIEASMNSDIHLAEGLQQSTTGQIEGEAKEFVLTQEDIESLSGRLEGEINKMEEKQAGDKKFAEFTREQAVKFIKKLEEKYLFSNYFKKNADITKEAFEIYMKEILLREQSSITRNVLQELLGEIGRAFDLEDQLYQRGLKRKTRLNVYQLVAVERMLQEKGVLLADEMGLGKTLQTLAAFFLSDAQEAFIVAPNNVVKRWMEEIGKHFDADVEVVNLSENPVPQELEGHPQVTIAPASSLKLTKDKLKYLLTRQPPENRRKRIIVINYDILWRMKGLQERDEFNSLPDELVFDFLVFDESQNIKNISAKQTQMIFGNGSWKGIKSSESGFDLFLSGTPLENQLRDVFFLLKRLAEKDTTKEAEFIRGLTLRRFLRLFSVKKVGRLSAIAAYLSRKMIRRLKEDVVEGLPAKVHKEALLDPVTGIMTIGERAIKLPGNYQIQNYLYQEALTDPEAFEKRFVRGDKEIVGDVEEIEEEDLVANVSKTTAVQLIRMEQAALDPGIFGVEGDSIKTDALVHLVSSRINPESGNKKKVLIFTESKKAAKIIQQRLIREFGQERLGYIDGDVLKGENRGKQIAAFQDLESQVDIFVVTTQIGGVGEEYTAAGTIIHMNQYYTDSRYGQANARAHRLDSLRNFPGKELEIIDMMWDGSGSSIDRMKKRLTIRKGWLSNIIVDGQFFPELLSAFVKSDQKLIEELRGAFDPVKLNEQEESLMDQFRLLIGEIMMEKDVQVRRDLFNEAAKIYMQILEHKSSLFAQAATIDVFGKHFADYYQGRAIKVLDLASGPSVFLRAYRLLQEKLKSSGLRVNVTDFDFSRNMLALGIQDGDHRQVLGDISQLREVFKAGGEFDLLNMSYAYRYVSDPVKLLEDANYLLKQGGVFQIILPPTNIIPPAFAEAVQKAGFRIHPLSGLLKSQLDEQTKKQYIAEYGSAFVQDMQKLVNLEFPCVFLEKIGEFEGGIVKEDLKVLIRKPSSGGEVNVDVESLYQSGRKVKYRILPDGAKIEGQVVYFSEFSSSLLEGASPSEEKNNSRIFKNVEAFIRLLEELATAVVKFQGIFTTQQRLAKQLNEEIQGLLGEMEEKAELLTDEEKEVVRDKYSKIEKRSLFSAWAKQHSSEIQRLKTMFDAAMMGDNLKEEYGGVDFSKDLGIQTQGEGFDFSLPAELEYLKNVPIDGFIPYITVFEPVKATGVQVMEFLSGL